jgi:hypothetical protein
VITGAVAAAVSYVLSLLLWSMFSKAAVKAIAVRHAKKAAHLHADRLAHADKPAQAEPSVLAHHEPESPPDPVPSVPKVGLGLAGEPFPEVPGPSTDPERG